MRHFKKGGRYMSPAAYFFAAGILLFSYAIFFKLISNINQSDVFGLNPFIAKAYNISMIMSGILLVVPFTQYVIGGDKKHIERCVKKRLFDPRYGNPLHFQEGELLPPVKCRKISKTKFDISIKAVSCTIADLLNLAPVISSSINGRYQQYAAINSEADEAFNGVTYRIVDVLADKSLTVDSVEGLNSSDKTKIPIDKETFIDLKASGSILVAGKTRSGKTTGIISILLSVLQHGRDEYLSNVIIIDPKKAELSKIPYAVTVNCYGEPEPIMTVMKDFETTMKCRQEVLNRLSEEAGNVVKWWDAGMNPSFLFIDEYVALKSLLPKPVKGDGGYNLAGFEGSLKRIITMGASAGCFVIISIAEASVEEGGLPSMLKSAMTTKILFKPTVEEARLIWNSEQLKSLNVGRSYGAGDCWFSSTDGVHDTPGYLHFPNMDFEVYGELKKLLIEYYAPKE